MGKDQRGSGVKKRGAGGEIRDREKIGSFRRGGHPPCRSDPSASSPDSYNINFLASGYYPKRLKLLYYGLGRKMGVIPAAKSLLILSLFLLCFWEGTHEHPHSDSLE